MTLLAPTMQAFFTERMIDQKNASPGTICAYRDTMRLLLTFGDRDDRHAAESPGYRAARRAADRRVPRSPRARPQQQPQDSERQAGGDPFALPLRGVASPEHAHTIARVIEIPQKTHERVTVCHLEPPEIKALLAAPDRSTWLGRRDHALLLTAIQTGLRVSELCGVWIGHVRLEGGASIQVLGKRRKQRVTPLTPGTVKVLRVWLRERGGEEDDPLFPTRQGRALSPKAIAWLLDKHTNTAASRCPSLNKKRVTRTCSGTPTRCSCSPRTTSRPSRSDSGTRARNRPRSICTPTRRSNRKRSTRSPRSTPHPAATSPPTSCLRSSTACEPDQLRQVSSSASPSTTGGSVSSRT
jgi:integrase/recombinase XerD